MGIDAHWAPICYGVLVTDIGLREKKRLAVAHDLAQAAFDLLVEYGLDGFTIDEVTTRAGYARRTFANHYSCKEEAVTALAIERLRGGALTMPPQPDGTSVLDWMRALAKHQMAGGQFELLVQLSALARRYPALEPYLAKVFLQIRREATQLIQSRVGKGVRPIVVSILVAAAYGALTLILDNAADPNDADIGSAAATPEFLDTVFTQLESGF
ncbi:MAG: hypothetical protein BGO26_05990 [Actinobacteria bacterium 69-20]|nr:TetR/AcrR family transcriptional regulator [Actinomycetota bacterium]OJV28016.1 MAG: hypothetical protein BGO26_05990 [Actinobacteria bacterium 69-20]